MGNPLTRDTTTILSQTPEIEFHFAPQRCNFHAMTDLIWSTLTPAVRPLMHHKRTLSLLRYAMSGKRQVAELQAEEYGAAGAGPSATQLLAPIRKFNKLGDALAAALIWLRCMTQRMVNFDFGSAASAVIGSARARSRMSADGPTCARAQRSNQLSRSLGAQNL
jgi:hypothetical protein